MKKDHPSLLNPEDWTLAKAMYFDNNGPINEDLDPIERLERYEAKSRHNNKSSR